MDYVPYFLVHSNNLILYKRTGWVDKSKDYIISDHIKRLLIK